MRNPTHLVPLLSASGEDVILVPASDISFVEVTRRDDFDHIPVYRRDDDAPWGVSDLKFLYPTDPNARPMRIDFAPEGSPPPSAAKPEDTVDCAAVGAEAFTAIVTHEHLISVARRLREQSNADGEEISEREAWVRANEIRARALGWPEEAIAAARFEFEAAAVSN
jgi:hypothetical protein